MPLSAPEYWLEWAKNYFRCQFTYVGELIHKETWSSASFGWAEGLQTINPPIYRLTTAVSDIDQTNINRDIRDGNWLSRQGHARARGHTTGMRVATNRAGILLAIMRPGQLKSDTLKLSFPVWQQVYFRRIWDHRSFFFFGRMSMCWQWARKGPKYLECFFDAIKKQLKIYALTV